MRRTFWLVLCLLGLLVLSAISVFAQTGIPTSYVLKVYAQGATTATSTLTVTMAQFQCDQDPSTGTGVENPTTWRIPDRTKPGRQCAFPDAARFTLLPDGSYEGTFAAVNADGSSAESARVPFTRRRPNPPAVPTGVFITQ